MSFDDRIKIFNVNVMTSNILDNNKTRTEALKMIGERIRDTREKNGLTQAALAKKLGISRSAVNAWELGVSVPSAQYLVELSRLFNVSTDFLLGLDGKEVVDISGLDDSEKKVIYFLIDYFNNVGKIVRNINIQMEADFDIIKKEADKISVEAVKRVLDEVLAMKELI